MSEVFFEDAAEALLDIEDTGTATPQQTRAIRNAFEMAVSRIKDAESANYALRSEVSRLREELADLKGRLKTQIHYACRMSEANVSLEAKAALADELHQRGPAFYYEHIENWMSWMNRYDKAIGGSKETA